FRPEDDSPALAQLAAEPGAVPSAAAGQHAFARSAAFAEHGAAPSVVSAHRCSFSGPPAGVLFPAAAGVSGDPALAWQLACPVVADISCPLPHYPCLAVSPCATAIRWHGCRCWDELR